MIDYVVIKVKLSLRIKSVVIIIMTVYFGGLAVSLNINKIQSRECNRLGSNFLLIRKQAK
jgi:hypothetical protein